MSISGFRRRCVSIHAPARGATSAVSISKVIRGFQSTPLHEGRPTSGAGHNGKQSFNPRPCTRGDYIERRFDFSGGVSIHAPARGATKALEQRIGPPMVSIHAPARGATHGSSRFRLWGHCFNPRPCTRGDSRRAGSAASSALFQSTPLHEGRHMDPIDIQYELRFQSTPLHEGRL